MTHRYSTDLLHTLSVFGSVVAVWGAAHAEAIQLAVGVILGVGGALWSFWLQQKAKRLQAEVDARELKRRQDAADYDERKRQEWLDFEQRLKRAIAEKDAGVSIE